MFLQRTKIIVGMAIIGTIGLFTGYIHIAPHLYALIRAVFASVEIGLFLLLTKQKIDFKAIQKEIFLFLISGAFLGLNWALLKESYDHIPFAVATLCDYFAPIIVIILCPIIYKEKLTLKQIICFVMATVGLLLTVNIFGGGDEGTASVTGMIIAFFAMLCYVPVLVINKLINKVNGIQRTFLQFSGAAVTLLIFSLIKGDFDFSQMNTAGWASLITVGIVHTGIAYCLYFSSLPHLPGQEGAILTYIDPLTAVFVSLVIMKQPMTPLQIFGGFLLLIFTFGNEIEFKKLKRRGK